jgi:signal transduction histidine kinase
VLDGQPSTEAATAAVEAEEAADLAYLFEHMPKAFDRSLDGLARVSIIVRSMKEFAHPDATEMTSLDLNRAIESTLIIACSEYKYAAELETSYGDIPMVLCHAGEINQAVLNIVINAAHAIGDVVGKSGDKGLITVRTYLEDGFAVIALGDTGGGIPAAVADRIFDPFFTTKEVGKGTGQGLAMARSVIVDKHRGQLTFETEPGRGTTFFVRLPVDGPAESIVESAA